MEKEITYLARRSSRRKSRLWHPRRLEDLGQDRLIQNLLDKVDTLAIVGGMAYTSIARSASRRQVSRRRNKIELAKQTLEKAKTKGVKLLLPVDNVIADSFSNDAKTQVWDSSKRFPEGWQGWTSDRNRLPPLSRWF